MADLKTIILAAADRPVTPVRVDLWPGTEGRLGLRTMSGAALDLLEAHATVADGRIQRALFVALSLVDAQTGELVFSTYEDVLALAEKSSVALDHLYRLVIQSNPVGAFAPPPPEVTPEITPEVPPEVSPGIHPEIPGASKPMQIIPLPPSDPRVVRWTNNCKRADLALAARLRKDRAPKHKPETEASHG